MRRVFHKVLSLYSEVLLSRQAQGKWFTCVRNDVSKIKMFLEFLTVFSNLIRSF